MTITKQVKSVLPFKVGAVVELSGKVTKRVRREGECKLVIEPGDVPGFVVFADCLSDAENITKHNIRKGSSVRVKGKFQTFGASAVCLSDCRLLAERNKK
jgi:primosomal replication protein N